MYLSTAFGIIKQENRELLNQYFWQNNRIYGWISIKSFYYMLINPMGLGWNEALGK